MVALGLVTTEHLEGKDGQSLVGRALRGSQTEAAVFRVPRVMWCPVQMCDS